MTFAHVGELPPLGIIQHALNPKLLKAYCINLADWLEKYLQDAPDSTFQPPRLVLEYLQYKNTKGDANEILECRSVFENVKEH